MLSSLISESVTLEPLLVFFPRLDFAFDVLRLTLTRALLQLLTSAWMKINPHRYQAFLSMPLDQYCAARIDTVRTEIDEVGLQALVDGVIEDSGFAVEIMYLDRSEGEAVTPHLLTPARPIAGTICLLYRP